MRTKSEGKTSKKFLNFLEVDERKNIKKERACTPTPYTQLELAIKKNAVQKQNTDTHFL